MQLLWSMGPLPFLAVKGRGSILRAVMPPSQPGSNKRKLSRGGAPNPPEKLVKVKEEIPDLAAQFTQVGIFNECMILSTVDSVQHP